MRATSPSKPSAKSAKSVHRGANGQPAVSGHGSIDREAEQHAVALDQAVNEAARHRQISIGAYYKAAKRGFAPGAELEDWLEAELEYEQSLEADPDPRLTTPDLF